MTFLAPALLCARAGLAETSGGAGSVAALFGMGLALLACAARMTHRRGRDETPD
ncbi:MAG: hypothetical protein PHF00_12075 [Elusimicrobia bacterium]|nr:hypothetical protein [Elusimicrobiota bacterium]